LNLKCDILVSNYAFKLTCTAYNEGSVACSPCEPGYFLPVEKANSPLQCRKCLPGSRSGAGAGSCFLCPPGQYGDQEAMAECFLCPPGGGLHMLNSFCSELESTWFQTLNLKRSCIACRYIENENMISWLQDLVSN
jgi:hypothetical protein